MTKDSGTIIDQTWAGHYSPTRRLLIISAWPAETNSVTRSQQPDGYSGAELEVLTVSTSQGEEIVIICILYSEWAVGSFHWKYSVLVDS